MDPSDDLHDVEADLKRLLFDPTYERQIERLHRLTVYFRWMVAIALWLTVGAFSLWNLRADIALIFDHFTWASLRYLFSLWYNPFPTLGLLVCIAFTVAILVWQSRNILWGLSGEERSRLERQLWRIRCQGESHPLWRFVGKE
ncbi:hypothetical protein JJD41_10010 [Oxynema sp. CENA135]|uniref:hypothetical protein n=1 Tax=Oxynema sp. CENA135 TaxID=984206 RepID=UPI00190BFA77|nr:hypothetical protein [Oxynema sp. CENA135]MBK4730191.1 hypothetical protein [Oxynema sp. CENA135]